MKTFTYLVLSNLVPIVASASGQFYFPPASEANENFSENPVYVIDDTSTIKYTTTSQDYSINVYQQNLEENSADIGPALFITTGGAITQFLWPVQVYQFDLLTSNVFFLRLTSDSDSTSFDSHFFNITEKGSTSSIAVVISSTSSTSSLSTSMKSSTKSLTTSTTTSTTKTSTTRSTTPSTGTSIKAPSSTSITDSTGASKGTPEGTPKSTTEGSSTGTPATTTSGSSQTSPAAAPQSASGLNTGAQVGIGAGVGVLVLITVVLAIELCRRSRHQRSMQNAQGSAKIQAVQHDVHGNDHGSKPPYQFGTLLEMPEETLYSRNVELAAPKYTGATVFELPNNTAPTVFEMPQHPLRRSYSPDAELPALRRQVSRPPLNQEAPAIEMSQHPLRREYSATAEPPSVGRHRHGPHHQIHNPPRTYQRQPSAYKVPRHSVTRTHPDAVELPASPYWI
ncbi:hypothetical protein F5Y18DRAFT_205201 [Xylariaceae sp. FL1019]|nr:hypothetical protein F5Y18DRAFT_205201 [Xylariaceae sp. FL1019]